MTTTRRLGRFIKGVIEMKLQGIRWVLAVALSLVGVVFVASPAAAVCQGEPTDTGATLPEDAPASTEAVETWFVNELPTTAFDCTKSCNEWRKTCRNEAKGAFKCQKTQNDYGRDVSKLGCKGFPSGADRSTCRSIANNNRKQSNDAAKTDRQANLIACDTNLQDTCIQTCFQAFLGTPE
jgi:hypothetical protein